MGTSEIEKKTASDARRMGPSQREGRYEGRTTEFTESESVCAGAQKTHPAADHRQSRSRRHGWQAANNAQVVGGGRGRG